MIPSEPPKLKSKLPKKLKEWVEEVRDWMVKAQPINGAGISVSETAKGRLFKVNAAEAQAMQAAALNPFNVSLATVSNVLKATVHPGYVAGNSPTIGGTPINTTPAPQLTVTATGTRYIYLKLTLTLTSANSYVYRGVFSAAEILEGASVPADDKSGGFYYLRLATIVSGAKQAPQPVLVNVSFYVQDTGDATSSADCLFIGV